MDKDIEDNDYAGREWARPTRWGVTDARIRLALDWNADRQIDAVRELVHEAGYCSKITALQFAREELSKAGADSQWLEVMEAIILRAMKQRA